MHMKKIISPRVEKYQTIFSLTIYGKKIAPVVFVLIFVRCGYGCPKLWGSPSFRIGVPRFDVRFECRWMNRHASFQIPEYPAGCPKMIANMSNLLTGLFRIYRKPMS
jgi:hypothetical protein